MKKKKGHLGLSNSFHYTLMVLPGYIWLFMFSIVPMVGIVMAFQDYNPSKGWFGSPWVGLKWFKYLTVIPDAKRALVNTLIIAIAKVILNIIIPLVFALLLNEVKNMKFKKTVQTIVYLPHFVSWVILANIITNILGANGIFNTVRSAMGATDTVLPMTMPGIFRQLLIGTDVWKEFGYNAVIYLAALTGISPSLYEAAAIDGASRWKRVWHITIPGLVPTIVLLTTLAMGNVLNAGFDQVFNMYNQHTEYQDPHQDVSRFVLCFALCQRIGHHNQDNHGPYGSNHNSLDGNPEGIPECGITHNQAVGFYV